MVSSRDVAKYARVSQSTVSRAFRQDVYIDPATKQRVLDAARQLGYYPNLLARSLKNQYSGIIGLMMTDPNNTFFASLIKQVEQNVTQRGYRLLLTYNDEDAGKERLCMESLLSSRADGILVMPVSQENQELYRMTQFNGISTVQIFRPKYDDLNTVTVNDELGAYTATKYLLEQGHRKIIMTEYSFNQELPAKTLGFRQACEEYGVDPEPEILNLPFEDNLDGLIAGAIASTGATAIIGATIPITLEILKACQSNGLRIPEDISIIAYDDSEWLDFLGITTITHPMQQIGRSICDILFQNIESAKQGQACPTRNVSVKPYLLLRKSVRKL